MEIPNTPGRQKSVEVGLSPTKVTDWSYRQLKSTDGLQCLADTEHLILDGNQLESVPLPFMPFLRTLSLNENKITDLDRLCDALQTCCPSLTHLSLIGNPACPHPLSNEGNDNRYALYRQKISYKLPQLKFLDSTVLSIDEKNVPDQTHSSWSSLQHSIHSFLNGTGSVCEQATEAVCHEYSCNKGKVTKILRPYRGLHSEGNRFIRDNQL